MISDLQNVERLTEFTPLEFTEDEDIACRNGAILKGLGTIELKLRSGTFDTILIINPTYATGPQDQSPIHQGMRDRFNMTERAR